MYGDVLDRLIDRKPSRQKAVQTSGRANGQTETHPRIKATFHLSMDDVLAIDRLQITMFSKTGKKPERSHIVSEALQLLAKHNKIKGTEEHLA